MNAALAWRGVVKRYRRRAALDGLDLEIPAGSFCGLVGSNGAGKTTSLFIAAGLTRPTAGAVDILGDGPFDARRHGGRLTILPQDSELPRDSRPRELLVHYARLQGLTPVAARASADEALERVHLADRAASLIRTLSHGMKKRVMIAQCFLGDPELVLLDEPLSGLDPRESARIRDYLLPQRGRRTVLISSHNLHEIEILCDRVAFIEQGRAVRMDTLAALTGRDGVMTYRLAAPPALEPLRAAAPDAQFQFEEAGGRLVCRYPAQSYSPDELNRRLLPRLLDAGVFSVEQGERLETQYLRQPPA